MLHILDRRTMSVVHSEVYDGPLGVGDVSWHDNEHLLITATYKSELAEGRGGAGLFLLNIRTKNIKPVWTGDGTADYGGSEGGSLGGKIDDEHYWLTVGPSGSSYSEIPVRLSVQAEHLHRPRDEGDEVALAGGELRVQQRRRSHPRGRSAAGRLRFDGGSQARQRRVGAGRRLRQCQGCERAGSLAQDRSRQDPVRRQSRRIDHRSTTGST